MSHRENVRRRLELGYFSACKKLWRVFDGLLDVLVSGLITCSCCVIASHRMSTQPICLVERAQRPEAKAREIIAELYCPIVYRWARRWGVPRTEAAQVTRRAIRSLFKQIGDYSFSDAGLLFRSCLWTQLRYHAADSPDVNSMNIPERYPEDVPAGWVTDDTARLLRSAGKMLLQRFPAEEQPVFQQLLDRQQSPLAAARQLAFSLSEIRSAAATGASVSAAGSGGDSSTDAGV